MKSLLKNLLLIVIVLSLGYFFRDDLRNTKINFMNRFFPCTEPITYSIGTFDQRFGLSKDIFIKALASAEAIWEGPVSKDLFAYQPEGDLKVNLIYDTRQESTVQLKSMGLIVKNDKASYDALKAKYAQINAEYVQQKSAFQSRVAAFETRKNAYEAEVKKINARGGASPQKAAELNAEKEYLQKEAVAIQNLQNSLNGLVDSINALVSSMNQLARNLNLGVDAYNTIGDSLGGEFEEGTYESGRDGRKINIYQFDSQTKLVRVLAHEMGHALGLDHVEDAKAIMYRLNSGFNEKLTNTDLVALKKLCRIN